MLLCRLGLALGLGFALPSAQGCTNLLGHRIDGLRPVLNCLDSASVAIRSVSNCLERGRPSPGNVVGAVNVDREVLESNLSSGVCSEAWLQRLCNYFKKLTSFPYFSEISRILLYVSVILFEGFTRGFGISIPSTSWYYEWLILLRLFFMKSFSFN